MERGHGDVELAGVHLPWLVPVLGMGIVAAVFAYALGIAAARELGSKLAAFLGLTEVLFAVLFAWLLLDELPMVIQLAGRSDERRVGKDCVRSCRSRWSTDHSKKNKQHTVQSSSMF